MNHTNRTTQFTDPRLNGAVLQRILSRNNNSASNLENGNNGSSVSSSSSETNGANNGERPRDGGTGNNSSASDNDNNGGSESAAAAASSTSANASSVANVRATNSDNVVLPAATTASANSASTPSSSATRSSRPSSETTPNATTNGAAASSSSSSSNSGSNRTENNTANIDAPSSSNRVNSNNVEVSNSPTSSAAIKESISSCKEPLPKYKRDLVAKIKVLRQDLTPLQPQSGHCRLEVSRQEVFEDSYRHIAKMRPKDLRKRLMIKFRGEDGLDYGGVAREWLYLLSHEMLNPYYGLFQYSRDDIYTLQINPDSAVNPDHLSYFHFVGRIIGMSVFHAHHIDGGFTTPFYKMLLNKPITLADIESVDPELHSSLRWMLENDISNVIDHTFAVEHEAFGVVHSHELKKGGKDIQVNIALDVISLFVYLCKS